MTIFSKIINKEIPSTIVYEDDQYLAFKDINPKMKTHLLIIPKKEGIESFHSVQEEEDQELVQGMLGIAWKIIDEHKLTGCKLVFNSGENHGQEIFHIHLHLQSQDSLNNE